MIRILLLLLLMLASPAAAQLAPRENAIQPQLIAEGRWWRGLWLTRGVPALPMAAKWQLPEGASVGPLRYPVPSRLTIAGLMNYVYERDYAVLVPFKGPGGAHGGMA